ncbi:hypothetical protein S7711_02091 [Stachybotrys chartarum IBT 7711]|uniref:Uncharacterized protein n=1 Tax=Stachybotrys chartarum (strain CBS 109288 / IBT 7711) TaxID=1280523 RepID=A0A084ARF1_STACB|nr:hypothetical protein S7711_02091 [Stachybotrys chartarum IBT 7711]KFA48026.1 hypothetical protein S40293_02613 [Stachybotrys chartarum IBT 40293]
MPKRSLDIGKSDGTMPTDKIQRKTERSHEENQERAYIAASRRADRSLEARVQSARMASEIHKKRTGKGFRITEEIVSKEEMYEEEEDEFPRSYRLLGPHMQTASAELNSRVETYLSNRMAMSALLARTNEDWKQNEINRLFAQSFPHISQQGQQIGRNYSSPEHPVQSRSNDGVPQSPGTPTFHSINYQQNVGHGGHGRSMSTITPTEVSHEASSASPPALSPGSYTMETPRIWSTPSASHAGPVPFNSNESAFTTELPAEAKMLMGGMDMGATFGQNPYSQDWFNQNQYWNMDEPTSFKGANMGRDEFADMVGPDGAPSPVRWDSGPQPPSAMDDQSWNAFIDENAFMQDPQSHNI